MQQHAEAIGNGKPMRFGVGKEWGDQRDIDNVGDQRIAADFGHIEWDRPLAFHAKRRRVDEKARVNGKPVQCSKGMGPHLDAEAVGQLLGAAFRAVCHMDGLKTALDQRMDNCTACAARPNDQRGFVSVPARRPFIEICSKAISIRVCYAKPAIFQPKRVGRADDFGDRFT